MNNLHFIIQNTVIFKFEEGSLGSQEKTDASFRDHEDKMEITNSFKKPKLEEELSDESLSKCNAYVEHQNFIKSKSVK